jgi:hypothetical protein
MRVISSCILQTSIHACNQFMYSANEHTFVQSVHVFCKRAYIMLVCRIHELIACMYARLQNTWTDYTHVCSFAEYMNWLHACMLVCRIHELITRMYSRLQNTWTDCTHVCSFAEYMNWLHACMLVCRIHELITRKYTRSVHVFCKRVYMRVISSRILQTSIHACNQFMYSANENTCV